MLRIGIVAGEVSGDLLAASLMHALKSRFPDVEFTGIAGPRMIAAGCKPIFAAENLSVMGLVEVLGHLPELLAIRREIFRYFLSKQPDLFIGVDAPDFNLGLAKKLHRAGIPTVHYVSPSVWAWRPKRVKKIIKYVDRILTLLPFEADLYNQYGDHARFVGHPLADEISGTDGKTDARRSLGLESAGSVLAVLPGSRVSEIERLGDTFSQTVKLLKASNPKLSCIAPMVNGRLATKFRFCLDRAGVTGSVTLVDGMARQAITAADVVLTASGTASLETMLVNRPMVVAYKIAPMTHFLVKALRLLKISHYSLPNILANETIVPEFMQENAVPEKIAAALSDLLQNDKARQKQTVRFKELHNKLRRDASMQAAQAVGEILAENDRSMHG